MYLACASVATFSDRKILPISKADQFGGSFGSSDPGLLYSFGGSFGFSPLSGAAGLPRVDSDASLAEEEDDELGLSSCSSLSASLRRCKFSASAS